VTAVPDNGPYPTTIRHRTGAEVEREDAAIEHRMRQTGESYAEAVRYLQPAEPVPDEAATAACEEFGWYTRHDHPGSGQWVPCDAADPGARPDVTRLRRDARWAGDAGRWQYPVTALPDCTHARPGYAIYPDVGDGRPDTAEGTLSQVPYGRVTWRCGHRHPTAATATACAEAHLACLLATGRPVPQTPLASDYDHGRVARVLWREHDWTGSSDETLTCTDAGRNPCEDSECPVHGWDYGDPDDAERKTYDPHSGSRPDVG
jgi:hypothetical protein